MKGASWLVAGGTVAGLVAVLSYHTETMPATALGGTAAAPQGTAASSSASPSASATSSGGTQAASAGSVNGTATGATEQFGYGTLAVSVTVKNGRITNLGVPTLQTAEPTSQQISDEGISIISREVMASQGLSNVNAVSGATYTSEAYAQSLQSALDKLHFK